MLSFQEEEILKIILYYEFQLSRPRPKVPSKYFPSGISKLILDWEGERQRFISNKMEDFKRDELKAKKRITEWHTLKKTSQ